MFNLIVVNKCMQTKLHHTRTHTASNYHSILFAVVEAKPKIKIAIIGAGISGLCAVRHSCKFLDRVSVTVFEEGAQIKSWWDYPKSNGEKPSGKYLR